MRSINSIDIKQPTVNASRESLSMPSSPTPVLSELDENIYQKSFVSSSSVSPVFLCEKKYTDKEKYRDFTLMDEIYSDFTGSYDIQLFYDEQNAVNKIVIYNEDDGILLKDSIIVADNPLRDVKSVKIQDYINGVFYLDIDGVQIIVS